MFDEFPAEKAYRILESAQSCLYPRAGRMVPQTL